MTLFFLFALGITAGWIVVVLYLLVNARKVGLLQEVDPAGSPEPSVVVIVAVRNEERDLRPAMERLCLLQYRDFHILAINDRSTDSTPGILRDLARGNPVFTTVTIEQLPQGWLGKNHALYYGVENSSEEWILFTDADVHFQPDALTKAMAYAQRKELDHLTVLPAIRSRSLFFNSIADTFKIMLELQLKPWKVKDPGSKAFLGVGAFNLVRRKAYARAGTHKAFSLRPDDDLQLGRRIKQSGGKSDVLYGDGALGLEWYTSVGEFVNGLMKNTFSVFEYNPFRSVPAALLTLLVFVLPLPLMLIAGDTTERLLALLMVVSQILLFTFKRGMQKVPWFALMVPVAGVILFYVVLASTFKTLRQRGIYWRDTFYPLSELRKQKGKE